MNKFAVVVDSTAVVGGELLSQHDNLYSIPLKLLIGGKTYDDGIDLTQEQFFELMEASEGNPSTSQPSVGELESLFERLLGAYEHIFYITLSAKISGTFQSGYMIAMGLDEERITVIDSAHASVIHKELAKSALEMIAQGRPPAEIERELLLMRGRASIYLIVDELHHLHRSGRLGSVATSVGTMLQVKPILGFEEGSIVVKQKIRTSKKAFRAIVKIIEEENLCGEARIMLAHAAGLELAEELRQEVLKVYPDMDIYMDELSPVLSMHTGPGTVGLAWIRGR